MKIIHYAITVVVVLLNLNFTKAQEKKVLKGKELFGALSARQIGPALMSGRISDIEAHPTNARVMYLGTAGGGVWKSLNGGASFSSVFDDHCQSIGTVALDPNDPDKVVWVGTGEVWTRNSTSVGDGIYRSNDGGATWKHMGLENSDRIASIEINPNDSNEIYVGVLGSLWGDSDERGVYKTTDGGTTWDKIFHINERTGCSELVMDPNDPNTLYAAFWEFRRTAWDFNSGGEHSALYKSTDGGATWNKIHNGFPKGDLGRFAVAVAPSDSNVLYAVVETDKDEDKGLYRSNDGGASWKHLNNDFGLVVRPFYFSRITIDPRDPEVLVKAGLFGSISRDGGKTFKNLGNMHADIHDIVFDIHDSDRMYVATDGGLYRSWDGGTIMEIVANLPVSQFYHISVDNDEPYHVYGGLQDNGSWYGPSASPGGIEARDWINVGYGDGFRVLRHPTKKIVYSEMQGAQNVWRYDIERDVTKTIQPFPESKDEKLRFNWNAPIALSEHDPDRLFIGSQFLHISNDMGDSWKKISPDLTTDDKAKQPDNSGGLSRDNSGAENHCTIFSISESPIDENIIWVGTDDGNVQITSDGGATWVNTIVNAKGLPKNTWCYQVVASSHDKATAYAVFDGHTTNDKDTYVYKTTDMGQTWANIATDDVVGFARSIQEDYENPNLLFLGTEFGLYATIDGGENWNKFTNNMPAAAVHYIALQKKTNDLVLGTHGRGVIIIDDISPLRKLTPEVIAKDIHFFDSAPIVMRESSNFGGGSTERQFVGPNPSRNAEVVYYLKKRHTFGKMTMEVFDEEGNKLVDLTPSKSQGINVVTWNYRYKLPKMAAGNSFSLGGFNAPQVPAGTYKIIMTKGKTTYSYDLVLENDPKSPLTKEQRVTKHRTTMKMYDMVQELAYMVYELDETMAKAETLIADGNAKGKKVAQPVIDKLGGLRKNLVAGGDNYVGTGKPQLREDMGEVYGKVAGSFEMPSSSDLKSIEVMEARFNEAKTAYAKIRDKEIAKMNTFIEKNDIPSLEIKKFEGFIQEK